jgi:hypothetical protein
VTIVKLLSRIRRDYSFSPQLALGFGVFTYVETGVTWSEEGIMMTPSSSSLATLFLRGYHFGGGRGNAEFVLLLAGLGFAGLLVWAIQRSGKSTT